MKRILFLLLLSFSTHVHAQSYLTEKGNSLIKVKPKAPLSAYGFSLEDVKLLDGSPFKHAMDRDAAYLLSIEPDRLLHRFYANAGLNPKAEVYGGWEKMGLSGHTLGHYLSACAMMYASTGNVKFKERADYIVGELAICQAARKSGYVGAIPGEDSIFWKVQHGIIKSSGFDLNGGWSPWYTVHKVMAGLTDAYLYAHNEEALRVVRRMADWTETILKDLNDDQLEQMRKCEYGGMNDVLVHLYELTADQRYLALSYKFHDHFILDELAKHGQPLTGKHSNTNVPKAIGCARRYTVTAAEKDKTIADFFWETIVKHHTYVIGGNSNYEYLGDPDKLNDRLSDNTCETCNTYNMLKLTRYLITWNPTSVTGDFYERALYNHILSSQNPNDGMMCYFVPLRMGTRKEFSSPFNTFTCCVGSGMENHCKYTEGIYFEDTHGGLIVNLFIPSELHWREKKVTVRQLTEFPQSGKVSFILEAAGATRFTFRVRKAYWQEGEPSVTLNGRKVKVSTDDSGYYTYTRTWLNGDKLEFDFNMGIHTESMPDNPNRVALLYGPIVLAGQLGPDMPDPVFGTSVLLTASRKPSEWVKATGEPLTFRTNGVVKPQDVTLVPFYKTVDDYYNVYWDYFTPENWSTRQSEYEAEKKRQHDIDQRTIDLIRIGEMQPERDHNLKASERSFVSDALGRMGREARSGGFFSFEAKVDPAQANYLLCSYIGDDRDRAFDFQIDGVTVATQELKGAATGRFFDVEYPIPSALTRGKQKVEVRVQAHEGKTAGRVFGCRILK